MAGVELFGRKASLVVAPLGGGAGLDVSSLRIVFAVEKTSTSEANKANIKIYNLAEQSRKRVEAKNQGVVLKAGYTDLVQVLFAGYVSRVEHQRQGVDIVTEMECKDGGKDIEGAYFRKSYGSGSSKMGIINDIISAMPNTGKGVISANGTNGSISGKFCFAGRASRALDKLARAWGFEWSVQDGNVQILTATGTAQPKTLALKLAATTGLVGIPSKTDKGAKFKSLLIPSIRPGSYVILSSEFVSGNFKVESCIHAGDTHGNDWTTDSEGKKL